MNVEKTQTTKGAGVEKTQTTAPVMASKPVKDGKMEQKMRNYYTDSSDDSGP